jgi:murein DD-endopeptidase MepM/ murein hydrolase activator NlpD
MDELGVTAASEPPQKPIRPGSLRGKLLPRRFHILFVAHDDQFRRIPLAVHYLYVSTVSAAIGLLSLIGIASSYTRMLLKVSHYNELRTENEGLKKNYSRLEQMVQERDIQVASLSSLANEVSALYGLKLGAILVASGPKNFQEAQMSSSLDQLYTLKKLALSGAATAGIALGLSRNVTAGDWLRANAVPNLWPVEGQVTGSFGERIDPFNGEGAFHSGMDISASFGTPVVAPADGRVTFAAFLGGYGRAVAIDHGHGISTRYGHLANFAVVAGQYIHRGDPIGYVGASGRSTGPHLHYEVRINETPVNPHKYMRLTVAHDGGLAAGS